MALKEAADLVRQIEEGTAGAGVSAPDGFAAASLHCGIKKRKPDLALLWSEHEAVVAGAFTQSRTRAANVDTAERIVRGGQRVRAVLVVSGNANACTGPQGAKDIEILQSETARALGGLPQEVLVVATGVIGVPLPMPRILAALPTLAATIAPSGGSGFSRAIMTTDKRRKEVTRQLAIDGRPVTIGAAAKGSGMIHPNMATMLGFLTTDADVAPPALDRLLAACVDRTFNRVTVDGDTSTNDMVLFLANGAAGNAPLQEGHPSWPEFAAAVEDVCRTLAKAIARDGEGATKLVTVRVEGAASEAEAAGLARLVAGSSLVKTALFGADPNFGRVLAVLGRSEAAFHPDALTFRIGGHLVYAAGQPTGAEEDARDAMRAEDVLLELNLGSGQASAEAYGCDLSYEYVRINGSYRT